jgi:Prokaryotic cytochrome b561
MTPIENTEDRYGAIAILLHWSMALLVIGLAALGLYMVTLPDVGFNTKKVTLVLYHKEFGVLVLVLPATRLAWRVTHILPRLVGGHGLGDQHQQGGRVSRFAGQIERNIVQHIFFRIHIDRREQRAAGKEHYACDQGRPAHINFHFDSPGPGGDGVVPRIKIDGSRLILVAKPVNVVDRLSRLSRALRASGKICIWSSLTVS